MSHDPILSSRDNPYLHGHAVTEAMLLADFQQNRLHHAYMFCGPKGIGKATLAYRFARHLLKHGAVNSSVMEPIKEEGLFALLDLPPSPSANVAPEAAAMHDGSTFFMDPSDPIFKRVSGSAHTDLLTLSPAYDTKKQQEKSEISVDQARKVSQFLALTPAESEWRVVIIDAVDQLNTQSSNALLKILEEPPPNSIVLLVCHAPAATLATIRSRCRKVVMQPCGMMDFSRTLIEVAPHIPEALHHSLFAVACGCPGQAVHYHAQHATETYAALLHALRPSATQADRQKFADGAVSLKSPAAWQIVTEMWVRLSERVYSPASSKQPMMESEAAVFADLRSLYTIENWCRYRDAMMTLLTETNVFNLDKRYTALLMVSPAQMLKFTAYAA